MFAPLDSRAPCFLRLLYSRNAGRNNFQFSSAKIRLSDYPGKITKPYVYHIFRSDNFALGDNISYN